MKMIKAWSQAKKDFYEYNATLRDLGMDQLLSYLVMETSWGLS